jgi:adenine-specific DNA-methyltransferase
MAYGSPSGGRAVERNQNIHDYILHYSKSYSLRKQNKILLHREQYIKDWFNVR